MSFVSCPATPNIELIKINRDAVVAICFGYPAFIKNKIGLKKILHQFQQSRKLTNN